MNVCDDVFVLYVVVVCGGTVSGCNCESCGFDSQFCGVEFRPMS